jgi:hypothetical protein
VTQQQKIQLNITLPVTMAKNTNSSKQALTLQYAFTLKVDLSPPHEYGITNAGNKRYIPITGGTVTGPKLQGEILPGGGDWNTVQHNGVVDGTVIGIMNEGRGRVSEELMGKVFQEGIREGEEGSAGWYTKTSPTFEVIPGPHDWLVNTCFVGDLLLPTRQDQVVVEIFEIV